MVLSDVDIQRYIAEGKIKISPPLPPEHLDRFTGRAALVSVGKYLHWPETVTTIQTNSQRSLAPDENLLPAARAALEGHHRSGGSPRAPPAPARREGETREDGATGRGDGESEETSVVHPVGWPDRGCALERGQITYTNGWSQGI